MDKLIWLAIGFAVGYWFAGRGAGTIQQLTQPVQPGFVPSPTGKPLNPFQDFTAYQQQTRAAMGAKPSCPPGQYAAFNIDPQTGAMSWGPCQEMMATVQ